MINKILCIWCAQFHPLLLVLRPFNDVQKKLRSIRNVMNLESEFSQLMNVQIPVCLKIGLNVAY